MPIVYVVWLGRGVGRAHCVCSVAGQRGRACPTYLPLVSAAGVLPLVGLPVDLSCKPNQKRD